MLTKCDSISIIFVSKRYRIEVVSTRNLLVFPSHIKVSSKFVIGTVFNTFV